MKNKFHVRWRLGLHASLCPLVLSAISVQEMYCWLMAQKLHSVKDWGEIHLDGWLGLRAGWLGFVGQRSV